MTAAHVFDTHQHHGLLTHSANAAAVGDGTGTDEAWLARELEARRASMDRLGIGRALILPGNSYLRPRGLADTRVVNDGIRAYIDRDPERFPFGLGVVEPLYGREGLAEIRRVKDELGLVGIAYHPRFQGVAANDPWIQRHLEVIEELGMIPFVHSHGDSTLEAPLLVDKLAAAHPALQIVVLDGFTGFHNSLECVALAERRGNLLFDTAMAFNISALEQFVSAVGPERLLFGSDIYSYPMTFAAGVTPDVLRAAPWGEVATDAVLGGNLTVLLRQSGFDLP